MAEGDGLIRHYCLSVPLAEVRITVLQRLEVQRPSVFRSGVVVP